MTNGTAESNTRWIVEVKAEKQEDFENIMKKNKKLFVKIGQTKGNKLIINDKKRRNSQSQCRRTKKKREKLIQIKITHNS